MQKNLVIVESPAKAKTIEKFLGKDYKVMSSYGHIRDLKKKQLSIDIDTLQPDYEIPEEKKKLVTELKNNAQNSEKVWLASDEDREGEAISWHLCEVLGLDEEKTNRIVFHEITKPAILEAIKHPRHLDMNLVNAQQARRVLDRLVGFKLSPVLWRKVKPALSAGRVQSVAVRLIVEREREIQAFKSEPYFRVSAIFGVEAPDGSMSELKAELDKRFSTHDEVMAFLEKCKTAGFTVSAITKKPLKRTPAPPFTTSTLQQEAARKLGFTVSQTMMVAQHLYENGRITYMRTDSVNLSSLCINSSKEEIIKLWGEDYSKPRQYHTHSKGAQEAHEAIRPTYMENTEIDGTQQEKRLYELIWKRTAACQMADAQIEKTTVTISIDGTEEQFVANGEVVKFDGFLKVYRESFDDDDNQEETSHILPPMTEGQTLQRREVTATQRFSQGPLRYTEASLVHKLEELGIGRPSTYAPTISTIQQREYVQKGDKKGEERQYIVDVLHGNVVSEKTKTETVGNEKGKLLPTDIGMVVNDFLLKYFPTIMDYNFTANVEKEFDRIADGEITWNSMIDDFYGPFHKMVDHATTTQTTKNNQIRILGTDPTTGHTVKARIGRYGPMVEIEGNEGEKSRFASLKKGQLIESLTLEEALALFSLPRNLGPYEGEDLVIGIGKFGPYVRHGKSFASLARTDDPYTIGYDRAAELVREQQARAAAANTPLKTFAEEPELLIKNGRYGPYIAYKGKNYRIPKGTKPEEITLEACMKIIQTSKK